jgi:Lar family restriction alleviation protein
MATNGEVFKTPIERRRAYNQYFEQCEKENSGIMDEFVWIDIEYKEELKPCPFCGSEASLFSGTEDHYVLCRNTDCAAALVARSFSSEGEAISAWNRRA